MLLFYFLVNHRDSRIDSHLFFLYAFDQLYRIFFFFHRHVNRCQQIVRNRGERSYIIRQLLAQLIQLFAIKLIAEGDKCLCVVFLDIYRFSRFAQK